MKTKIIRRRSGAAGLKVNRILVPLDLTGSTAERVVRHAPCPLLTVRRTR